MNIGAQLYTIRNFTKTVDDLDAALGKIAGIGYKFIQLSAIGSIDPVVIRKTCDKYGLKIILTHTNPNRILNDTDAVIEEHNTYDADYIGIGAMPEKYRPDGDERFKLDGIKWFVDDFSVAAEKIQKSGKKLMYHNHDFEFEKIDGKLMMEHLAEGFPVDSVGFTLDVYWAQVGGGDPANWLRKLSGRVDTIHYKDIVIKNRKQYMAEVMEGNLNWGEIFKSSIESGVKWAFVEQDDCYGVDPFKCMETSFNNLTSALAERNG